MPLLRYESSSKRRCKNTNYFVRSARKVKKNFLIECNCLTISEKKFFLKKRHFFVEHIDKNVIFAADLNTN